MWTKIQEVLDKNTKGGKNKMALVSNLDKESVKAEAASLLLNIFISCKNKGITEDELLVEIANIVERKEESYLNTIIDSLTTLGKDYVSQGINKLCVIKCLNIVKITGGNISEKDKIGRKTLEATKEFLKIKLPDVRNLSGVMYSINGTKVNYDVELQSKTNKYIITLATMNQVKGCIEKLVINSDSSSLVIASNLASALAVVTPGLIFGNREMTILDSVLITPDTDPVIIEDTIESCIRKTTPEIVNVDTISTGEVETPNTHACKIADTIYSLIKDTSIAHSGANMLLKTFSTLRALNKPEYFYKVEELLTENATTIASLVINETAATSSLYNIDSKENLITTVKNKINNTVSIKIQNRVVKFTDSTTEFNVEVDTDMVSLNTAIIISNALLSIYGDKILRDLKITLRNGEML